MRAIAIALLLAPLAVMGDVPSVWPDAPEGRVVHQWNTLRFEGAFDLDGEGGSLLAVTDAADGEVRVRVRRFDREAEDRWTADGAGVLLPLDGEHSSQVLLVADGDGGALVAWQSDDHELLLQRVVDGDGSGAAAWAEPTTLAEDVWIREIDARTAGAGDWSKALASDGAGGAWLSWATLDDQLRLQHVEADGTLDSDLPVDGLVLGTRSQALHSQALVPDDAGGVWVLGQDTGLLLRHVDAAGRSLPELGWLRVSDETANASYTAWCRSGPGLLALAWLEREQSNDPWALRLQVVDADLNALHGEPLEPSMLPSDTGRLMLSAFDDAFAVAWADPDGSFLQVVEADGEVRWPQPVALDRGGLDAVPLGLDADSDGPRVLLADYSSVTNIGRLWLEGLDGAGSFRWSLEDALRAEADGWIDAVGKLGEGDSWLFWQKDERLQADLVDSDGQGAWPDGPRTLATDSGDRPYFVQFASAGQGLAIARFDQDHFELERFDRGTGRPLGDVAEFDVPGLEATSSSITSDGDGGFWTLCTIATRQPDGGWSCTIEALRLLENGDWVGPTTAVGPIPMAYLLTKSLTPTADGGICFGFYSSNGRQPLQRLDASGQPQWGASGQSLDPDPEGGNWILALAARPDGGVDAVWSNQDDSGEYQGWLQSLDPSGQPLIDANEGRGHELDVAGPGWAVSARLWRQPQGGHLLATDDHDAAGWRLLDGNGTALRQEDYLPHADVRTDDLLIDRAPDGSWRAAWNESNSLRQAVWNAHGDRIETFSVQLAGDLKTLAGGWPLSLVSFEEVEGDRISLRGFGPAESNGPTVELWSGTLQPEGLSPRALWTPTASDGTLGLLLEGRYGHDLIQGGELRLQLIQAVDPSVAVDDPASVIRPQALRLLGNAPNPFNPTTWISFELGAPAIVRLSVFDVLGRSVRTLVAGERGAGSHRLAFDARSDGGVELASGVYFYRLSAGKARAAGRMLLLR